MWYVIWTLAQKEHHLKETIESKIPKELFRAVWIPMKTELRKYNGVETCKQIKLLPGYLLIDTDDPDEIHQLLRREKEYIRFLESDGIYIPLSAEEEAVIRHFSCQEGKIGISVGVIKKGMLTVLDGPLKGMEDSIVKIDRHRRKAWVHFDKLLGEARVLTLGLEVIEASD